MPFCIKCGKETPANASCCPSCGARIPLNFAPFSSVFSGQSYETEFERLTRNSQTQDFWFRRLIAYVIDSIIVAIAAAVIAAGLFFESGLNSGLFQGFFGTGLFLGSFFPWAGLSSGLFGVLSLGYFTVLEASNGKTLGKNVMALEVETVEGAHVDYSRAFIRNVSKVFWLLLLLDLLAGFFAKVRPGQKYSDYVANTLVVLASRSKEANLNK